jgi:hypothetical protein
VSSVLIAIFCRDADAEAETYRLARVGDEQQSYDARPVVDQTGIAALRRFVTRPPAGWQAS